jgi:hypothetical protein
MMQLTMDFETRSPINAERLKGQNGRLYEYLSAGNTIHCFHPARYELQIGYLNSRIADLIHEGVEIYKRNIKVSDVNGELVTVREYSLKPFIDGVA